MDDSATCAHGRSCGPETSSRGESKREHDFYRYYEPIRQMTEDGPTTCNVLDPEARAQHKPFSCPDTTLTAFCQLGALRMHARRAMLFFFDIHNAYVMAESTQTLSLENDAIHGDGDQLWLGHAKIPRNVACCEITINLPSFPAATDTLDCGPGNAFVVNDLAQDERTNSQPYVTDYPHARFYAAVPIRSPSGINIGAFCILDDQPRQGVSDKDLMFLHEMSRNIMRHLETIRAQAERRRVTRMVKGLGAFVKSSETKRTTLREAKHSPRMRASKANSPLSASSRPSSPRQSSVSNDGTLDKRSPGSKYVGRAGQSSSAASPHPSGSPKLYESDVPRSLSDKPKRRPSSSPESVYSTEAEDTMVLSEPRSSSRRKADSGSPKLRSNPQLSGPYHRAAEIMRDSLSVDGVAFVDASVGTFGGLAESIGLGDSTETSTCEDSDATSLPSLRRGSTEDGFCKTLGSSGSAHHAESGSLKGLTESALRVLLRRYPHGKIWAFDENGTSYSEDELSSDNDDLRQAGALDDKGQQKSPLGRSERRHDGRLLQRIFPGARSVIIHGIRDARRKRWTAGCLMWSYDPIRVLTTETEINLVAAFCDIIAGETRRLEAQKSDKAKSDFISSISHELRSPLHGILGSSEALRDMELDNMTSTLVEQIDSCGRTLLDIIDHLLDFASLSSQRLKKGAVSSSKIGPKVSGSDNGGDLRLIDRANLDLRVALDELTEDVVESTVYSFPCRALGVEKHPVPVFLDITHNPGQDWRCRLAAGGWKRITMNLINNALKYTSDGWVHVSLQQVPRKNAPGRHDAVLTVLDTGKGMSKDFQQNHLFRDFMQEDTFADGMGLGMNMVGRIVYAMGGQIEVVSDQGGSGSRFTVTIPLEEEVLSRDGAPDDDSGLVNDAFAQRSLDIGIIQQEPTLCASVTRQQQHQIAMAGFASTSIANCCHALGMKTHVLSLDDCHLSTLNFVLETDFIAHMQTVLEAPASSRIEECFTRPWIVVCNNNASARKLSEYWRSEIPFLCTVIEFIALPFGVKTISRAVASALRRHQDLNMVTPVQMGGEIPRPLDQLPVRPRLLRDPQQHADAVLSVETRSEVRNIDTLTTPIHEREAFFDTQLSPLTTRGALASIQQVAGAEERQGAGFFAPATSPSQSTKGEKPVLLLVDDNKINLQLLTMYAKKQKYPYITATDGQLAVDAYQGAHKDSCIPSPVQPGRPTVIFMDINMPVLDGFEATQLIRVYEKKHNLPAAKIIALTALGSDAAHKEAFGSGCDMFMTKPVKLKDLTKIIEDAS